MAFANTRTTTNAVAAAFTTNRLTGTDRLTGFRMMATAPAVKVRTACSIFLTYTSISFGEVMIFSQLLTFRRLTFIMIIRNELLL